MTLLAFSSEMTLLDDVNMDRCTISLVYPVTDGTNRCHLYKPNKDIVTEKPTCQRNFLFWFPQFLWNNMSSFEHQCVCKYSSRVLSWVVYSSVGYLLHPVLLLRMWPLAWFTPHQLCHCFSHLVIRAGNLGDSSCSDSSELAASFGNGIIFRSSSGVALCCFPPIFCLEDWITTFFHTKG